MENISYGFHVYNFLRLWYLKFESIIILFFIKAFKNEDNIMLINITSSTHKFYIFGKILSFMEWVLSYPSNFL